MKKILLLAALLLAAFSCSDDDPAQEIDNVTTLNMRDAENGKTYLGNSDIFINEANNFKTSRCLIAEIGPSKGLGKVLPPRVTQGLVRETAVLPGHLYQAFPEAAVRTFPSGKPALSLAGDYYQFHVGSAITEGEKNVGAVVRFSLLTPEDKKLPTYDSTIGTLRRYWESAEETLVIYEFPKDTEFEWDSHLETYYKISIENGVLKIQHRTWDDAPGLYALYARHGEVYTKVYIEIEKD